MLDPISFTHILPDPMSQLVDMGGPIMLVLMTLTLLGAITFCYLMLIGALYAPRMTGPLKRTIEQWQQEPSSVIPSRLRPEGGLLIGRNPLRLLVADVIDARKQGIDGQKIREIAARDAERALEPFEAPLKIMEVIAALAPLLGLLGTVIGMMEAFGAMASAEGRADAALLSGGIYKALTTTAAGLVVAIPFAALAAWVEFRLRRLHGMINGTLVTILNPSTATVADESPTAAPTPSNQGDAGTTDIPDTKTQHEGLALRHATG
ncbi:MotA/TolQ/ExbB proton channel family protein [Marinobacter sp. F4216]|uniref:MotA/TolQ/ExbB proton channel family protein n=1 Tax=Marinobacter sp. F4216 TaxID=2874281 RepID=UPI001CBD8E3C|nr:MotA/TolQ/ExbB proton channel family protein [Marinobacter sp. F4216]MBZ2169449.1 MotA/TolQ/ExbB proton channel family protein [Marinobacter sp. F4216]